MDGALDLRDFGVTARIAEQRHIPLDTSFRMSKPAPH
jgi:hypothetical protein